MQENTKEIFSINKRIIESLENMGVSRYRFAKETGVSETVLLNIYKGKNRPKVDLIQKVLKFNEAINAEWLILGQGPMLKQQGVLNEPPTTYGKENTSLYKELFEQKEQELREAYKEIGKLQARLEESNRSEKSTDNYKKGRNAS